MAATDDSSTGPADDSCTTSGSFDDHGIDDGADLIQQAYYRMSDVDAAFYRRFVGFHCAYRS
jgi:hypothetical protein